MSTLSKMSRPPANKIQLFSSRVYNWLLLAYPVEFRRDYGPQMAQVFRDCCRQEHRRGSHLGFWRLWWHTLADLLQTATREHMERFGKENSFMNNLRRDAVAVFGCIGIIVVAVLLLYYGRRNEVSSILMFGYALDALVTTGVIGNLIVFLLVKTTRLNPLRIALWTFLIVHSVLVLLLAIIAGRNDPQFSLGSVLIGYVVSFLFWFGLHWLWARSSGQLAVSSER